MLKKNSEVKPVEYYLDLDYPVTSYKAPEGGFVMEIEDLPGCLSEGETLIEAYDRIEDVKRDWIEIAYEDGQEIPLPRTENEYSGKFMVRIAKYLHRDLADLALKEGVSLNQMVQTLLSSAISVDKQNSTNKEIISKLDTIERQLVLNGSNRSAVVPYLHHTWEVDDINYVIGRIPKPENLDKDVRMLVA
ncbi:toxin-antitoxin system HicB family antitoxin [Chloroflexota bacterium]